MNEAPLGLLFGILTVLIILSAFFSSSETGMMSLNRYRLKHLKKNNHKGARRASRLLKYPDRLISLILIGNNLVNFTASAIVTVIGVRLAGDAGIAVATLVFTMVVLIFAEITPKTIAAIHPERIAFPASGILNVLGKLLYPVIWLVNSFTNTLVRLMGVDMNKDNEQLSTDELRTIVGEAGHHIPERHQAMLLNILDLEQVTVDDIMVQRNEVFCIDIQDEDATIIEQLLTCEFTRVPVVDGDIDNVLGFLHLRHAGGILRDGQLNRDKLLGAMREPYFIPEAAPLHTQMFNFQKNKRRQGLVVDEYGDILGLVTLEDILEEIVGEFTSGLADDIPDIIKQHDESYVIHGSTTVREINKSLDWELPIDGPKTLGGLIIEQLEAFPSANVGLKIDNYMFEILQTEDKLIEAVRAEKIKNGDDD